MLLCIARRENELAVERDSGLTALNVEAGVDEILELGEVLRVEVLASAVVIYSRCVY